MARYRVGGVVVLAASATEAVCGDIAMRAPAGALLRDERGVVLAEREPSVGLLGNLPTWRPTAAFLEPARLEVPEEAVGLFLELLEATGAPASAVVSAAQPATRSAVRR